MPCGRLDRTMKRPRGSDLILCLLPIEFQPSLLLFCPGLRPELSSVRAVQIFQSSVANSAAEKDDVAL